MDEDLRDVIKRKKRKRVRSRKRFQRNRSSHMKVENVRNTNISNQKKGIKRPWKSVNDEEYCNSERQMGSKFFKSESYEIEGKLCDNIRQENGICGLGFHSLKKLLMQDMTNIVMQLISKKSEFQSLLQNSLRPDIIMLVVEILKKISFSQMKENVAAILAITVRPNILERFSKHSCDLVAKDLKYTKDEVVSYFNNLGIIYHAVIEILPNTAADFLKEHLIRTSMAIQGLITLKKLVLEEVEQTFKDLISSLNSVIEERKSSHTQKKCNDQKVPWKSSGTDFRNISVFPSALDVLRKSEVQLSPVVTHGPYQSVEHYLEVHFHLMREDFLIPLRKGIMNYIDQKSSRSKGLKRIENVRFYEEVRFLRQFVEGESIISEVQFNLRRQMKNINWERTKRILYGSLVCFSSDNFETLFIGIIVNRDVDLLKRGIFQCELIGDMKEEYIFDRPYIMAESEVYFESYQHVLKALKSFSETNFPLKEYLINVSSEAVLPNYLQKKPNTSFTFCKKKFLVSSPDLWPSFEGYEMNISQQKAVHSALTQKLAVIQGPPGTGKTYIGLIIAKMLLENSVHWKGETSFNFEPKGPILLVCYTNHALDQFLEGILTFTTNIVRIGSQSKNSALKNYNLKIVRRREGVVNSALKNIEYELLQCAKHVVYEGRVIEELSKKVGLISLKYLCYGMDDHHYQSFLQGDSSLIEWLLAGVNLHNYNAGINEFTNVEDVPEDMKELYAYSLKELLDRISEIEVHNENAALMDIDHYNLELCKNDFIFIKNALMEPADERCINQLLEKQNLNSIQYRDRWLLYNHWLSKSIKHLKKMASKTRDKHQKLCHQKCEILDAVNFQAVLKTDFVGMTTTGASKQQTLLQKLGSKIVIVEEAAEIMESHVLVSLSKKCEHLILIGDHKQLRPEPAVYKLAKEYNFDVSLFERMLINGVSCNTLDVQHRMRPEITDLIVPAIYPSLKNHESVMSYQNILGIKKNLFFISHTNAEETTPDDTSKQNIHEAKFLIALCRHIILQGYEPSQITILTTYKGQMFSLMEERDKLLQDKTFKDVRITVVDNYQGEENEIILLSLVRNNKEGKIGFLGVENRVCVAFSRAKKGLYIMGNIELLAEKSSLWTKIKGVLEEKESIGTHLTLKCVNHPTELTEVCKAEDFIPITEGGCTLICGTKLACGHVCKKMCHTMGHTRYDCKEICGRKMCIHDHRCKKQCYMECGQCEVPLECSLPCGHKGNLPCHADPSQFNCLVSVTVELPNCKHTIEKKCYEKVDDVKCSFRCEARLDCGHVCLRNCHVTNDPEHLDYKCHKQCGKKNKECKENHNCQKQCYEQCNICTLTVCRKLPNCNHFHEMPCHIDPETINCEKKCNRMLSCGHKCPLICSSECGGCIVLVEKEIPDCKHKVRMKCSQSPKRELCDKKCERMLKCGHVCQNICGLPCNENECEVLVNETGKSPCEHDVKLFCHELNKDLDGPSLLKRCEELCSTVLKCGHKCRGTCGECMQGRIHVNCQEKCGKRLICGHSCRFSCSEACRPCTRPCYIKCKHSLCKNRCGFPCALCKENCDWRCKHLLCHMKCGEPCDRPPCEKPCEIILKCGHPCIGFCGEECPQLCKICNADELKEILDNFGSDDDLQSARFVILIDCGHVFESKWIDQWMNLEENTVKMKECPQCTTIIQNTYRYGNIVKKLFVNVLKVKHKCYGDRRKLKKDDIKVLFNKMENIFHAWDDDEKRKSFDRLKQLVDWNERRYIDSFSLNSLKARMQFVLSIGESYEKMIPKLSTSFVYKKDAITLIKKILNNLDFITPQEHNDFTCECIRFHLNIHLGAVENSRGFKTFSKGNWYKTYMECKALISSLKQFPKELYEKTENKINEIYKLLSENNIGLTKVEMNDIVKAVNLRTGHWLLCPNGHVYVIGDCGGAVQTGKCNECGESIGGTSHQLISTNTRLNTIPEGLPELQNTS